MDFGSWDLGVVAVKLLAYAATLGSAGGVFFLVYAGAILPPGLRASIARRTGMLLPVAIVAALLKLLVVSGSMSDGLAGMTDRANVAMLWQGGENLATGARLAGLLLAGCVLLPGRRWLGLAALGAALAASSFAWLGHAHAANPNALPQATLALHLLAVAFWLGALWPLWLSLQELGSGEAAAVIRRFSRMALYTVAALIAAGSVVLVRLLTDPGELWSSAYGRLMLGKLLLVAAMLGVAALNKLSLTPRLEAGEPSASSRLRRSVAVEMALALGILATTAALTTLTGP